MDIDQVRQRLELLRSETKGVIPYANFISWKSRSLSILRASFGAGAPLVHEFENAVTLMNEGYVVSGGAQKLKEHYAGDAMKRGDGVLDAAIYALDFVEQDAQLDEMSIDPELWAHVHGLVSSEDWGKIPATTAVFVEDAVRRWGGDPRGRGDTRLVGKDLYTNLLNTDGVLRLGKQGSEWEGWRNLATGLAQAIGNVDRHSIQRRPDAKRYAMGVLGLGSLLLTQLRREHEDSIVEVEARGSELDQ